jgi:hypothetical protein
MAHPCPYAELSPSIFVALPVSRRGSAKSSELGGKTAAVQKAFSTMAIIKPAVPPHRVQTRISRISAKPPLQSKPAQCHDKAADLDEQGGMAGLPVAWFACRRNSAPRDADDV